VWIGADHDNERVRPSLLVHRNKDWAATPFGPLSTWPSELKMALGFCLFSRFPMVREAFVV
jgi:hypothetical protein